MSYPTKKSRTISCIFCCALFVLAFIPFTAKASSKSIKVLHSFNGTDGSSPAGAMVALSDDELIGATYDGGKSNLGTIFNYSLNDNFTVIHEFMGPDGSKPEGGLTAGPGNNIYGATQFGGSTPTNDDAGTLYKITSSGAFQPVYSFQFLNTGGIGDGGGPTGNVVLPPDGSIVGTTFGGHAFNGIPLTYYGTIFQYTESSNKNTNSYVFTKDSPVGYFPLAGLTQGPNGDYYGTTTAGGSNGKGAIFKFSISGGITLLHAFSTQDGYDCRGPLLLCSNGEFIGITQEGGKLGGGTILN